MNAVKEALTIQGRVLLALMLREARTRYGRRPLGYLWALVEPAIHISLMVLLFGYLGRSVPLGESLPMFLATGYVVYFGFRNVMNRTEGGYGSNEALLSFPIVKIIDVFLGRAVLEVATWWVVITSFMTVLILMGHGGLPHKPLLMLEAIAALAILGFSIGVIIGILSQFLPSLTTFVKPVNRVLYFISGIFMLPDQAFPGLRAIMSWNPLMHGITLFRTGYYPGYHSQILDVLYLWKFTVIALLLALITERMSRKYLRNLY